MKKSGTGALCSPNKDDKFLFKTKIPQNATVQTVELKKETVFKVRSNATGAITYRELAAEIIDLCKGV